MDVEQVADELGIRKPVTPDQVFACAIAGQLLEIRRLLEQTTGGTVQTQQDTGDEMPEEEREVREPEVAAPDEHRCDECGRMFANAGALGSHARSHKGDG